jgi:hypothetical protein
MVDMSSIVPGGQAMPFVTLEDEAGLLETVLLPRARAVVS